MDEPFLGCLQLLLLLSVGEFGFLSFILVDCFEVMADEESSSPIPNLDAFRRLEAAGSKRKLTQTQQKIVKKLENIPSVALPVETCQSTLNIVDRGLIGQFTGL